LYIAPQFRSLGLGAKLLAKAEDVMRKSGATELSLDCACKNITGRMFYECNGWRVLKTTELPDGIHKDIVIRHWVMVK
ncbi:MAG: GNAT family N-acetyltransferase, partial [Pseudomonadota bacterium]|nr:GNAT family N-acetyltransferase [Pseudomonadota bacterium]